MQLILEGNSFESIKAQCEEINAPEHKLLARHKNQDWTPTRVDAREVEVKRIVREYFKPANRKIPAIRFVRAMFCWSLIESKLFVENDCNWLRGYAQQL